MGSKSGFGRGTTWGARASIGILKASAGAGLVVGLAAMLGILVSPLIGLRMMVVTSGSMEPAIATGDAVILKRGEAGQIRRGDVITFRALGSFRGMTTHRVVTRKMVRDELHFQTKGDANDTPDANLAPASNVYGRVILRTPKLGFVVHFLKAPPGRLLVLALPAAILAIWQAIALFGPDRPKPS